MNNNLAPDIQSILDAQPTVEDAMSMPRERARRESWLQSIVPDLTPEFEHDFALYPISFDLNGEYEDVRQRLRQVFDGLYFVVRTKEGVRLAIMQKTNPGRSR